MLVTTFRDDIRQFKMFCHCLAKNWQGKRQLIVCIGAGEDIADYQSVTDEHFDRSWHIDIKPSVGSYNHGPTEQQTNTVHYSVTSGCEDVIIWDCKDFLLRPCDISHFKKDGKYRWTYILSDTKLVDLDYDLDGFVDYPIDNIPGILNLRPWIWNVEELKRYWERCIEKFGPYTDWKLYPLLCEIYGYYIFALSDPERTIDFLGPEDTPLMLGGGWTHQTYEGILKEVEDFDRWPERVVWKHSRKLKDPRCVDVTKLMLSKYGIKKEIIDRVFG